jgi:hypothetical protein
LAGEVRTVPKGSAEMVAAAIRTIFAQPDAEHVRGQLDTIAGMLGRQLPKVESMLRDAAADITAFADFPVPHWKKIWSTNPNGSTKRSNAVPTSSASFPTPPHCYDWLAPCSSKPTTNGKSATNATYPKPLWLCSNPPPTQATNPLPCPPLSRHSETHRASGETPALEIAALIDKARRARRRPNAHEASCHLPMSVRLRANGWTLMRCGRYVCAGSPAPDLQC